MSMTTQDRVRLKANPPNVSVPQGYRDLYIDENGNLVKESPDGTKKVFYPMEAVEFAGANPNIPETVTVTGITDPVDSDPLVLTRGSDVNSKPAWQVGGWFLQDDAAGSWELTDNAYYRATIPDYEDPFLSNSWSVNVGAGLPSLTGDNPIGVFIGQRCLANPDFWSWNGAEWLKDSN